MAGRKLWIFALRILPWGGSHSLDFQSHSPNCSSETLKLRIGLYTESRKKSFYNVIPRTFSVQSFGLKYISSTHTLRLKKISNQDSLNILLQGFYFCFFFFFWPLSSLIHFDKAKFNVLPIFYTKDIIYIRNMYLIMKSKMIMDLKISGEQNWKALKVRYLVGRQIEAVQHL